MGRSSSHRQLEAFAVAAATDVASFYAQREPTTCPDADLLVLTFDGKGIVMRPESLREATAKAVPTGGPQAGDPPAPGEKHGRKRMAKLVGVYDATPDPRAPGDVISRPDNPIPARPGPAPDTPTTTNSQHNHVTPAEPHPCLFPWTFRTPHSG